jgi:hypothetical protein
MKPLSLTGVVMGAVVLSCSSVAASGPVSGHDAAGASGAPMTNDAPTPLVRPTPTTPAGLNDSHQPIRTAPAAQAKRASADADDAVAKTSPTPLWRVLDDMTPTERLNADIELEPLDVIDVVQDKQMRRFEALWSQGSFAAAINVLRTLDDAPLGMGVSWRVPQAVKSRGLDARIGDPRTDCDSHVIDFDAATGNLFVVAQWGTDWSLNISTDHGATWTQTYAWNSGVTMLDVDAAVVSGYVYVSYVVDYDAATGRLRRCTTANGAVDTVYDWHSVISGGADILDMSVASNADDWNNRLYYAAIMSDNTIQWHWCDSYDGTVFYDESPSVANAASGLDMHWNEGRGSSSDWFFFLSYVGLDDNVHVLRHTIPTWEDMIVDAYTGGSPGRTAISAYEDTVICAFEYAATWGGQGIKYQITYNAGDHWNYGTITDELNETGNFMVVDVTARGGGGTAAVFCHEIGEPDDVFLQHRPGYQPGPWNAREKVNDYDVTTGSWTAINYLPHATDLNPNLLETTTAWDGLEYISSFGETNTATYAQTFTVPTEESLDSFSLYIDDLLNTDFVDFEMFVGAWDTVNNRVLTLYGLYGPYTTTNNDGLDGMEQFTCDTTSIALYPGNTYVIGVIASRYFDGESGTSQMGYIAAPGAYAGGQFVFLNNGDDFNAIYTDTFYTSFTGDLAFEINFTPPWSYGLTYIHDYGVPYFDRVNAPAPCPWDNAPASGDGTVGLGDLNALLSNWGPCPAPCVYDFMPYGGDGTVGLGDLNALLSNWGPCP